MENENRHNEIRTVHPNRLTPKGIVILAVITILLLALALYLIPWPARVVLRTTGAEVDSVGNVIAEGNFVLEAQYQQSPDHEISFTLTHLELPNLEVLEPGKSTGDPAVFMSDPNDPERLVTTYSLVLPHPNGKEGYTDSVIVILYTDTEFSHFLITYKDSKEQTHYYIGAEQGASGYTQILNRHGLLDN